MFTRDEKTTALSTVPGTWPINDTFFPMWASLVAQMVKNLPAMQETWVQSLGQEDPLEKGMAIHSSILAWMGIGVWEDIAHGVTKSWTRLSD